VNATELRACCLAQVGAFEDFPFGPEHSVFKVVGKMFALSALDRTPLELSVKCEPEIAVDLRASYAAIRPGYHLNKRHWNTITLDGSLPDRLVHDLIEDSYDLVVSALPKRTRKQPAGIALASPARPGDHCPESSPGAGDPSRERGAMQTLPSGVVGIHHAAAGR
jgi:predicted DNA-binding protein (MmcQ/YjbR family)